MNMNSPTDPENTRQHPVGGGVLIVDDEPLIRWSMMEAFTGAGYTVVTASSVADAKCRLLTTTFALVITDLKMHGDDGFALISAIRRLDPSCPVIIISAYGDEETRRHAHELGVDRFLDKPIRLNDVLQESENVLRLRKRACDTSPEA